MIKDVFKQLWKDKFARAALIVLGLIYLALFLADFIAPYTKDFSDRTMAYVPPSMRTESFQSLTHTITAATLTVKI